MGKYYFEILRNQRQKESISVHDQTVQSTDEQKKSMKKLSQTKNIILNYRSIFKKIINDKILQGVTLQTKKKMISLISSMEKQTNINMIKTLLCGNKWFQEFMIKIGESGELQRYIFQSNMQLQNKFFCMKYLNCLLNAFKHPQNFTQWVPFVSGKKSRKSLIPKNISKTSTECSSKLDENDYYEMNLSTEQNDLKVEENILDVYQQQMEQIERNGTSKSFFDDDYENDYQKNFKMEEIYKFEQEIPLSIDF